MLKKFLKKNRAQIWVETVIYILISLTIIAIILSMALPQIEKLRDKGTVQQTITALNILNNKILETEQAPGNVRIVNFQISKGKLTIDSNNNNIQYVLENTGLELTQVGQKIKEGDIILETQTYGKRLNVFVTLNYSTNLNITVNNAKENKILQAGTAPYKIQIENMMYDESILKTKMNFNVV